MGIVRVTFPASSVFRNAGEVQSQAVYPLASKVLRRPPLGKDDASGSPWISCLPENSTNDPAVGRRGDEGIVLFRRDPRQGLKPVGIVGRPFFERPILHGVGDHVGHIGPQRQILFNRLPERLVNRFGQPLLHDLSLKTFDPKTSVSSMMSLLLSRMPRAAAGTTGRRSKHSVPSGGYETKMFPIPRFIVLPITMSNRCAKAQLLQRIVFGQPPDPAGAGPGAEAAADAAVRIDDVFVGPVLQLPAGDRVLRAEGLAEAAVPAGAAGGAAGGAGCGIRRTRAAADRSIRAAPAPDRWPEAGRRSPPVPGAGRRSPGRPRGPRRSPR